MHRPSFTFGLVIGTAAVLGVTVALPGSVTQRGRAGSRRNVAVSSENREYRVVTGQLDEEVRFLPLRSAATEPVPEVAPEPGKTRKEVLESNETAAIATMRNIIRAQAQFQTTARADENNNGVGEYGSFGEISAAVPVRGTGHTLSPPLLAPDFRTVQNGRVERHGYLFQVFLPRAGDWRALAERADGGYGDGEVCADLAETTWCVYAWPKEEGVTGNRTFFVSQGGDITATSAGYSGKRGPNANAAFRPRYPTITGQAAKDERGCDGALWKQAG